MFLLNLFLLLKINIKTVSSDLRTFHILEEVVPGTKIVNLAKLFNLHQNKEPLLTISDNQAVGIDYFQIDQITFDLKIRKSPDRDEICSNSQDHCYIPLLILYGNRAEPSYDQISIEILDINDNAPKFSQLSLTIPIPESNSDFNSRIASFKLPEAEDKDTKENGVKLYRIDGQDSMAFKIEIDHKGPRLGIMEKLDRERKSIYIFRLLAIDGGTPARTGTLSVTVHIEDINDNKPKFNQPQYKAIINEDTPVDTTVLVIQATDNDIGVNGKVGFRIAEANNPEEVLANRYFKLKIFNNTSCSILVAAIIDCKDLIKDKLEFYVEAFDHGIPSFSSSVLIYIQINDINNNPPLIFVRYIKENANNFDIINDKIGTLFENQSRSMIAQITVKDMDKSIGNDVSCKTNDSRFYLDEITALQPYSNRYALRIYRLFNNVVIDREKFDVIKFLLICQDNIHHQSSQMFSTDKMKTNIQLTSTELIIVMILDVNDEAPKFQDKQYIFYLPENKPDMSDSDKENNYKLGYAKAIDLDKDENGLIEYSIAINTHNSFKIEKDTGLISVIRSFDREQNNQVSITIMATDSPKTGTRKSTSIEIRIIITDENDSVPKFLEHNYHFKVSENIDHAILGSVTAVDSDEGENSMVHYQLTKINAGLSNRIYQITHFNNFHVDQRTGQIRLRKRLDREVCNHIDLVVLAVDNPMKTKSNIQNTATTNVAITILDQNDNKPLIISPKNNQEFFIDPDQSTAGHPIFTVQATDADYGLNATVHYEIQYPNIGLFDMDRGTGLCYLKETLTERNPRSFSLQIKAYDLGTPFSLNSSINIRITRSKPERNSVDKQTPKSSGFFNHLSVSDKTLVIILTTIFILLILITVLLVAFVRYRKIFWNRISKKSPEYCQGTVMRNYVRDKPQSGGPNEKLSQNDNEKYQNLLVGAIQNNDKQTEKRRNQPCGYSEYGTLIHASPGQTFANRGYSVNKTEADYQALSQLGDRIDTYQLPTSHVIMNDPVINGTSYEYKPFQVTRNMYTSPSKRTNSDESSVINNPQLVDENRISIESPGRIQSLDAESSSPLMYRIYSLNDESIIKESENQNENTTKYSNKSTGWGSFIVRNLKATENSPKKSVFGSFV